MSAFLQRPRYPRNARSLRRRIDNDDDSVVSDWNKPPKQVLYNILYHIVKRENVSNSQKLGYLNCFKKYCDKYSNLDDVQNGFITEDIFCCLRTALLHDAAEVRAGGIRAIRHFINGPKQLNCFYKLNLDFLLVRCLDIVLENKTERIQALRLMRKLLAQDASKFTTTLTYCLTAIAKDGYQKDEKDALLRTCLACLAELLLLNPKLARECNVIGTLKDALLDSYHNPSIVEALLGPILHTLNNPELRSTWDYERLSLHQFISPFTDYPYGRKETSAAETLDEREAMRLFIARNVLLSLFRSWTGLFFLSSSQKHLMQREPIMQISQDNFSATSPAFDQHASSRISSEWQSTSFSHRYAFKDLHNIKDLRSLSAMQVLMELLKPPFEDTRRHILEFLSELLQLPLPDWTDDFDIALGSLIAPISTTTCITYGQVSIPDQWSLYDGFIAAEGRQLLPSLYKGQNLADNHLALLLKMFVEADLPNTLCHIIVNSTRRHISVRATILLGQILQLCNRFLPSELAHVSNNLAPLLKACIHSDQSPHQRSISIAAVNCLQRIQNSQKRPLEPFSLQLQLLVQQAHGQPNPAQLLPMLQAFSQVIASNPVSVSSPAPLSVSSPAPLSVSSPAPLPSASTLAMAAASSSGQQQTESTVLTLTPEDIADTTVMTIEKTMVLRKKESGDWDWPLIHSLLTYPLESFKKLEHSHSRLFIRHLIHFYKPSSRHFSALDQSVRYSKEMTFSGMALLRLCLDGYDDERFTEFMQDFLQDLKQALDQCCQPDGPPAGAFLSSVRLISGQSAYYFLFLCQLSNCNRGRRLLEQQGFYAQLMQLVSCEDAGGSVSDSSSSSLMINTNTDTYTKLIISSMYYGPEAGFSRTLLAKVLTGGTETSRLFATNFLRILLRLQLPDFRKWVLELLIQQLIDRCTAVQSAALDILDEACEVLANLDMLIALRPQLLTHGDRGILILARFASTATGLQYLQDTGMLGHELQRWNESGFQLRYAKIIEQMLNDQFTLHVQTEDGSYGRRTERRLMDRVAIWSGVTGATTGSMSAFNQITGPCSVVYMLYTHKDAFTPPHLLGSLAAHPAGGEILHSERIVERLEQKLNELCNIEWDKQDGCISNIQLKTNKELSVLCLKGALWSIGHLGSGLSGLRLLQDSFLIEAIVRLASYCDILSIRAVSFYALGLIGSNPLGAKILFDFGWTTLTHKRHEKWPLCEEMLSSYNYLSRAFQEQNLSRKFSTEQRHDQRRLSSNSFINISSEDKLDQLCSSISKDINLNSQDSVMFIDADANEDMLDHLKQINDDEDRHLADANRIKGLIQKSSVRKQSHRNHLSVSEDYIVESDIELDGGRLRSSSDAPERADYIRIAQKAAPSESCLISSQQQTDRNLADRKYPAIGSHSLELHRGKSTRPYSQTLPPRRSASTNYRPQSQQYLTPYSSSAPKRKISEPTNPSAYHPYHHPANHYPHPNICSICGGNIGFYRTGAHSTFNEQDDHYRSHSESFGDSSEGSNTARNRLLSSTANVSELSGTLQGIGKGSNVSIGLAPYSRSLALSGKSLELFDDCTSMEMRICTCEFSNEISRSQVVLLPSAMDTVGYATLNAIQRRRPAPIVLGTSGDSAKEQLLFFDTSTTNNLYSSCAGSPCSGLFGIGNELPWPHNLVGTLEKHAMRFVPEQTEAHHKFVNFNIDELDYRRRSLAKIASENEFEGTYIAISLPSDPESLFCLLGKTESSFAQAKSSDFKHFCADVKLADSTDGLLLHSKDRCLLCKSRFVTQLKPLQSYGSKLTVKGDKFSKTKAHQSPEVELDEEHRTQLRKEAIKLIQHLISFIASENAERRLLNLKQKYPSLFQDLCLYSELCLHFTHYSFRLSARKFLQELFQDIQFDQLFNEAEIILRDNMPESESISEVSS